MRALLAALLLPLWAGAALALPNTLYLHAADPANTDDIPMNLLAPPAGFTFRSAGGPPSTTVTCVSAGGSPQQEHTVHGIQYAGPVDDAQQQAVRGEWRGLAYATQVTNATLHWSIESGAAAAGQSAPAPLANVVVRASLRQGEDPAAGTEGYDRGVEIAAGASAPALLARENTQGATYASVDGRDVYGFEVPLGVAAGNLTETGFNLRVDVLVDNPVCATAGGEFMAPLVLLHSSDQHRPRLDLTVAEPLRVLASEAETSAAGIVHLRTAVLPVWGGYAAGNVTVAVEGPGPVGNTTASLVLPRPADPQTRPATPAYSFWNWDVTRQRSAAGTYTLTATASDLSGNTLAAPPASFTIEESETHPAPPGSKGSPSLAGVLLVAPVALALLRARRVHR